MLGQYYTITNGVDYLNQYLHLVATMPADDIVRLAAEFLSAPIADVLIEPENKIGGVANAVA